MSNEQLTLIHKSLSEILVLLRDNPKDETNPSMWNQVYRIVNVTEAELDELNELVSR